MLSVPGRLAKTIVPYDVSSNSILRIAALENGLSRVLKSRLKQDTNWCFILYLSFNCQTTTAKILSVSLTFLAAFGDVFASTNCRQWRCKIQPQLFEIIL